MVRISDARMSGTAFGTIVLHVTPEAATGGPLARVHTGDRIRMSVKERRLDLLVDPAELSRRRDRGAAHRAHPRLPPSVLLGARAAGRRRLRLRFPAAVTEPAQLAGLLGFAQRRQGEATKGEATAGRRGRFGVRLADDGHRRARR